MLGTTIAVGLGPFIGGFLYDNFGSIGCFAAACIFSFLALAFIILIDVDKYDTKDKTDDKKSHSGLEKVLEFSAVPVSLFTALTSLGYVSILSFYRLYAAEVNLAGIFSWFFIVYSFCLVLTRPLAGRIQDNGGDLIVCVVGIIAQSVGLMLIAMMPSEITVIICAIMCGSWFWNSEFCMYGNHNQKCFRAPKVICAVNIFLIL